MSLLEDEKKDEERAKSVFNERAKITATYLNGIAIALVAVGTVSPAITAHPASATEALLQGGIGLVCVGISALLHYAARRILGDIR